MNAAQIRSKQACAPSGGSAAALAVNLGVL
jgi:hypothetical protein